MSKVFPTGILVGNGSSSEPSIAFQEQKNTGFFKNYDGWSFAVQSTKVLTFMEKKVCINHGLSMPDGAIANAVMRGDADGNAFWTKSPTQSGAVRWNSIYSSLSINGDNKSIIVPIYETETEPSVVFSQEANFPVTDQSFYITNKTNTGFSITSTLPALTNIINASAASIKACRLANDAIGVAYYDISLDRVRFVYSLDSAGTQWVDPITIDDVSAHDIIALTMINGRPAIAYIYDEGLNDEWRFSRATDVNGNSWAGPYTFATSSQSVAYLPLSINIIMASDYPVIFYNDEYGLPIVMVASAINGESWNSGAEISNLNNHQILDVLLINNKPALLVVSNIDNTVYYVRAIDNKGESWPVAATQLFKNANGVVQSITTNKGRGTSSMFMMNGVLHVAVCELSTDTIWLNYSADSNGDSWSNFNILTQAQTSFPCPRYFINNGHYYMLYNLSTSSPSTKGLITFSSAADFSLQDDLLSIFDLFSEHIVLPGVNGSNSVVIFISDQNISLLRFYENDLKINWISHV